MGSDCQICNDALGKQRMSVKNHESDHMDSMLGILAKRKAPEIQPVSTVIMAETKPNLSETSSWKHRLKGDLTPT